MVTTAKTFNANSFPEVLLITDLMEILHISRKTARKLLSSGAIKAIKIGASYRIPRSNLEEFMMNSGLNGDAQSTDR